MKFLRDVEGAPDIPDRLLQAHEEGKVVFFCGAGISNPANLPTFRGLVDSLYERLGDTYFKNENQKEALKTSSLDLAILLLEQHIRYGKKRVREAIAEIFSSPKISEATTSLHRSLLTLSKDGDGKTKLVTTNYDRIFEMVKDDKKANIYVAPSLPLVNSRWDGIVYLHGLLEDPNEGIHENLLVASSADFGLAYLIDRWASQFLEKLFLTYSVCFIGYSLNDPLVRYMTDAINARRCEVKKLPEVFAFSPYRGSKSESVKARWNSKGVTAIVYNQRHKHILLRKTMEAWSESYKRGYDRRAAIVQELASNRASHLSPTQDMIGQMVWALRDPTGRASKKFAETVPVFDLKWLDLISEYEYDLDKLEPICESDDDQNKADTSCTLLSRPLIGSETVAKHALVSGPWQSEPQLDEIFDNLGKWLTHHLNNPKLLLWVQYHGGVLHPSFKRLIFERLKEIDKILDNSSEEQEYKLKELKAKGRDTIPSGSKRILWQLMIDGKFGTRHWRPSFLMNLFYKAIDENSDESYFIPLLEIFTPYVYVEDRSPYLETLKELFDSVNPDATLEAQVGISDDTATIIEMLNTNRSAKSLLGKIVIELSLKLRDAMELYNIVTEINDSVFHTISSIKNLEEINLSLKSKLPLHVLTYITLASWKTLKSKDLNLTESVLYLWESQPYTIFWRLYLYGLEKMDSLDITSLMKAFKKSNSELLWSSETEYEIIQILKKVVTECPVEDIHQITDLILSSLPGQVTYGINNFSDPNQRDKALWKRLEAMDSANPDCLDSKAKQELNKLRRKPEFKEGLSKDGELAIARTATKGHFSTGTPYPEDVSGIIKKIKDPDWNFNMYEQLGWRELCSSRPELAVGALLEIGSDNIERYYALWNDLLTDLERVPTVGIPQEDIKKESYWRKISEGIEIYPDDFYKTCARGLSWWLLTNSEKVDVDDPYFLVIARKMLSNPKGEEISLIKNPALSQLQVSATGNTIEAILKFWFRKGPEKDGRIPSNIKKLLALVVGPKQFLIGGLVVLGSHLDALFTIDPEWTREHLLSLTRWSKDTTELTTIMWRSIIWNPLFSDSLLAEVTEDLIQVAKHLTGLESEREMYVYLICNLGVYRSDLMPHSKLAATTNRFKAADLQAMSYYIRELIKNPEEKLEDYWKSKVAPFLKNCWPKDKTLVTADIAQNFALMCIYGKESFTTIYKSVRYNITEVTYPGFIILELERSGLCETYPTETLDLISTVIGKNPKRTLSRDDLAECLKQIVKAKPALQSTKEYSQLANMNPR